MKRTRAVSVAVLIAGLLAQAREVRADDLATLQGVLDEAVVTTASRMAEKESTAPATSTTITSEELHRYGLRNLAEAVDFLSLGVFSSYNLVNNEIGARGVLIPQVDGFQGDPGVHILLLINGHTVNEPFNGTAHFGRGWGIPLELIDHIEVITGPGSPLYGANAMLGVISVVTKRAKDYAGVHLVAEGQPFFGARLGAGLGYAFDLFGTPSELTMQVEYEGQKGPNLYFTPQNTGINPLTRMPTRYTLQGPGTGIWGGTASHINYTDAPSMLLRFLSGDFELNVRTSLYRYSNPAISYRSFDDPHDHILERSLSADAKYRLTLSAVTDVMARVYVDIFDQKSYFNEDQPEPFCGPVSICEIRHPLALSRWAGSEWQVSFDWLKNARLVTLLGVDGRLRYVQEHTEVLNYLSGQYIASDIAPLESINYNDATVGAYGQQMWQPTPWLGVNAGARVDYDKRFPAVVSPRVAATVKPWANGTLRAIYVESFRAPTFADSFFHAGPILAPVDLQPERMRSVEASLEQKVGRQRLLVGVFRSWWSNMIENHVLTQEEVTTAFQQGKTPIPYLPFLPHFQARNLASIDNYGLNAGYEGAEGDLRYGANLMAVVARQTEEVGAPHSLPVAPQIYGNARLSYDLPGAWPVVAIAAKYFGKRIADIAYSGNFQPVPYAPAQLELRGTISGLVPQVTGLSYRLSANYSFASQGPYGVGPVKSATPNFSQPFLNPIPQFQSLLGLQYDFL